MKFLCVLAALATSVAACSSESKSLPVDPPAASTSPRVPIGQLPTIDVDALLQHTRVLSSDEYEGRAPGTKGEELSVKYLTDEFRKAGLQPGNTDGTYVQK